MCPRFRADSRSQQPGKPGNAGVPAAESSPCARELRNPGEAITAQQKGEKLDYVIPDETILIENPIAATTKAGAKAKAFIDYATSAPAQKVFAAKGYRSVIDALVDRKTYPDPPKEFDITKFGGWDAVMKKFFDSQDSVMQRIEQGLGVSTG